MTFQFPLLTLTVSLILLTTATTSADPFGDGKFGGQPRFCKPYTCPSSSGKKKKKVPVPKWPLRLTSTGCSSLGGMQVFSGKQDNQEDPNEVCCDRRAACLQTCGSIKTVCDEEFTNCTKTICSEKAGGVTAEEDRCNQSASIYQLMINMEQCSGYDQEQYTRCECVNEDQVLEKRISVLTSFYKKFNPDGLEKVAGLAEKADSPRKMANLMTKLVRKYPESVKKIKDPKQERMEQFMKESQKKEAEAGESSVKEDQGGFDNDDEEVQEL